MKYVFYALCCVPYLSLFLFEISNRWTWPQTSGERIGVVLLPAEIIVLLCPVVAIIGALWLFIAIDKRGPILPPLLSTLIGIAPGLFLWIEYALGVL
jgi:hypothetical protein